MAWPQSLEKTTSFQRNGDREDLFAIVYAFERLDYPDHTLVKRFSRMMAAKRMHGQKNCGSPRVRRHWKERLNYVDQWAKAIKDFAHWAGAEVDEVEA